MTQNNTQETIAFLRQQHTSGSTAWQGLCLKLTRMARGLPAVYPSALAAQLATPEEDRIYDPSKVTSGMVLYFDDPNDSNPFGHICTAHGRNKVDRLITWTNDAKGPGRVDAVFDSFFPKYWGDSFQFAAKSLNGFKLDLPELRQKPEQVKPLKKKGRARLEDMIQELENMIAYHRQLAKKDKQEERLVRALKRDKNKLQDIIKEFS